MEIVDIAEMTKNRRHLHRYPELSLEEQYTAAFIKEKLVSYGLAVEEGIGGTYGLLGILKVNDGEAIGYRADMDGLPIVEMTTMDGTSENHGCMHACGHDGHMAMALALAKYSSENRHRIKYNLVFIFQPAEENHGGALRMIRSGFLEKHRVKYVFGVHVAPEIPEGYIGCTPGVMMSRIGMFNIEIHGTSSHSATPQKGNDALLAACHLVVMLQSIMTTVTNPLTGTMLSIGKIVSGTADNLVSAKALLAGTMRSVEQENYFALKHALEKTTQSVVNTFGCNAVVHFEDEYPEVNNDLSLYEVLEGCIGKQLIKLEPQLLSEDFSYYQERVPGLYIFVGIQNKEENCIYPLHSNQFVFRDEALTHGVDAMIRVFEKLDVM